jgi:hypothetical protein
MRFIVVIFWSGGGRGEEDYDGTQSSSKVKIKENMALPRKIS